MLENRRREISQVPDSDIIKPDYSAVSQRPGDLFLILFRVFLTLSYTKVRLPCIFHVYRTKRLDYLTSLPPVEEQKQNLDKFIAREA